jgi:hypothetical protein
MVDHYVAAVRAREAFFASSYGCGGRRRECVAIFVFVVLLLFDCVFPLLCDGSNHSCPVIGRANRQDAAHKPNCRALQLPFAVGQI